jgi:hypothetical protein
MDFAKPAQNLSDEEADAKLAHQSAQAAAGQAETLAQAAPEATEPLDPSRLNTLSDTLGQAAQALGGGQLPDLGLEKVDQPVEQVPPFIFAAAAAFAAFAQDTGLEQYAFDPVELAATNDGIGEMAATISQMANDPAVTQAGQQPPQQAPAPTPEPEQSKDLDRFIQ